MYSKNNKYNKNSKNSTKNKKATMKMADKGSAREKGVLEEYFYMLPCAVTVRELAEKITDAPEEAKEIWTELDLMEIVLEADSLILENMTETFTEPGDEAFLKEHGIQKIYAVNYNTLDKPAVRKVLLQLEAAFGGFLASDTEDLQPVFAVSELV